MAFNVYDSKYKPELITIHDDYVANAFDQAASVLNSSGCDVASFLELYYDGSQIYRIWDNSLVQGLTERERLRLFPQLNGLFKLSFNNKLYPA